MSVTQLKQPAPPNVMNQLALAEEAIMCLRQHDLEYTGIDLRQPRPIIHIKRPESPLAVFTDGYTRVRPQTNGPLYGQAGLGACHIRWEEEKQ